MNFLGNPDIVPGSEPLTRERVAHELEGMTDSIEAAWAGQTDPRACLELIEARLIGLTRQIRTHTGSDLTW
jgi:hypothetical protein